MQTLFSWRMALPLLLLASANAVHAKPIAFGDGYTMMYEYGADLMQEAQVFYAPKYWYSLGGGYRHTKAEGNAFSRDETYLRANLLAKRWNLDGAQANVFLWAGAGVARGSDFEGSEGTENAGFSADYETLRVYSSLKSDWAHSSAFASRTDTLQLGWAPYKHRYDGLAAWVLFQARHYTGGMYDGIETAAMFRLFKGPVWWEAGVTNDGKLQTMLMLNF